MSRSGYIEYEGDDPRGQALFRGRVANAIRGRRGQSLLSDLAAALEAMPDKSLLRGGLSHEGEHCSIGLALRCRGHAPSAFMPSQPIGDEDHAYEAQEYNADIADVLDVAEVLVQEIEWENDEGGAYSETPEQRHARMLRWAKHNLKEATHAK